MAVTRKPKQQTPDEFISQGGSATMIVDREVATAPTMKPAKRGRPAKAKEEESGVKLRLSLSLLERIDGAVDQRKPSPSRHQWILEAIYEKLDREAEG
jgi:hypothetical protein